MNNMTATLETHPLAVGSDGYKNFLFLEGKVNDQSSADDHESVYNVKFTTTLGFTLTMGYSRYNDQVGTTHAWVAFGELCSSRWQKELGVDLLLNLVGYRCMYGSDLVQQCSPSRWRARHGVVDLCSDQVSQPGAMAWSNASRRGASPTICQQQHAGACPGASTQCPAARKHGCQQRNGASTSSGSGAQRPAMGRWSKQRCANIPAVGGYAMCPATRKHGCQQRNGSSASSGSVIHARHFLQTEVLRWHAGLRFAGNDVRV